HGWIPLSSVIGAFRQQPDVRAYLQAAAFTDHLLKHYGSEALRRLWRKGSSPDSMIGGRSLSAIKEEWKGKLAAEHSMSSSTLARVESNGCG
ncbi:MAG TPA: hypothetical protein VKB22_12140, partial [Gemmatimonadales bacterium]|nr:hypothetical protein [Gemmatimonadales bacterium]